MRPHSILHFWFEELTPKQHFVKDPAQDDTIRTRFGATLEAAAKCELFAWRATPEGRLAEIIVLDQFSRNAAHLCAGRTGPGAGSRAGGQRVGPTPAPGATQVRLHALHAQRVGPNARAGRGLALATGFGGQPGL